MTVRDARRASPRGWALAALAALAVVAAGLVQVVVGSRQQLLQMLVGTALSAAVMAATAWWAFTTRRVWKRWLNILLATLAVANILLGFLEFGFRQAAGAAAIVLGSLAYATAARRALGPPAGRGSGGLWTAGAAPSAARLPSRAGAPHSGGAGSGTPANAGDPTIAGEPPVPGAPWLVVNPRSGDGKAARVGLVEAARDRGIRVHVLEGGR
ncbi:MAG TPA: hypothetical protein VJ966_02270 [Actinomycetes bacterium]|nr:hypothetical protein [Actinomycetes bacterium]